MKADETRKAWAKIVAKAWVDETFKSKLLANPKEVLKENGIDIGKEIQVKVHENTAQSVHFILPEKPKGNLTEEQMTGTGGGFTASDSMGTGTGSV
jgi:hypothetical protein